MKKKVVFAFFFASLFWGHYAFAQSLVDMANMKRYAEANKEINSQERNEPRVVFLGNSITEGWVSKHPEFFIENGYIGRGIGGQTSYNFLLRFREDVINLHPTLVIINAGTNDIAENSGAYNEDYTMGNIMSMVELAQAHGIKVVLSSVLPAEHFGWRRSITDGPEKIVSLNNRIKTYAKKNKLLYIDYYDEMIAKDGRSMKEGYTNDAVHPTVEGYLVMEKLAQKVIKKALK